MDLVRTPCSSSHGASIGKRCAGGMYGNFAGRDASRGMAKQSFDTGMSRYECYFAYRMTQLSQLRNVDPH